MGHLDFLAELRREAETMSEIVASLHLEEPVPTCPGWTARDLIVHTGAVHRQKADTVLQGLTDRGAEPQPEPTGAFAEWFAQGVDYMLEAFETSDLSRSSWTWCSHDHAASWWVRRMAHETLIHGADAAATAGVVPIVDEQLAEDGIEEVLVEMIAGYPEWAEGALGDTTIQLIAPTRSWCLRTCAWTGSSPNTGNTYDTEFGVVLVDPVDDPDVTITGSAGDLDLWLWGRRELPEGAGMGDLALVTQLRNLAAEATQ